MADGDLLVNEPNAEWLYIGDFLDGVITPIELCERAGYPVNWTTFTMFWRYNPCARVLVWRRVQATDCRYGDIGEPNAVLKLVRGCVRQDGVFGNSGTPVWVPCVPARIEGPPVYWAIDGQVCADYNYAASATADYDTAIPLVKLLDAVAAGLCESCAEINTTPHSLCVMITPTYFASTVGALQWNGELCNGMDTISTNPYRREGLNSVPWSATAIFGMTTNDWLEVNGCANCE